jgi:hypothetical protein
VIAEGSVTKSETQTDEYYSYFAQVNVSYSFEVVDPKVGVQPVNMYAKSIGLALADGQSTASGFFSVEQTSPISGNPAKVVLTCRSAMAKAVRSASCRTTMSTNPSVC